MLELIALAIIVFVATNVDDVFVLLGFFIDPRIRTRQLVIGQFLGMTALFAASLSGTLVALVLSPAWVGLLGIVPIGLGLKELYEQRKEGLPGEAELERHGARSGVLPVALVTVANGGDNLGVYTPLFANSSAFEIAVIGAVFAAMTVLWIVAAHALIRHRTLGDPIRRHGLRFSPYVLIAIGLYILWDAGSFTLL